MKAELFANIKIFSIGLRVLTENLQRQSLSLREYKKIWLFSGDWPRRSEGPSALALKKKAAGGVVAGSIDSRPALKHTRPLTFQGWKCTEVGEKKCFNFRHCTFILMGAGHLSWERKEKEWQWKQPSLLLCSFKTKQTLDEATRLSFWVYQSFTYAYLKLIWQFSTCAFKWFSSLVNRQQSLFDWLTEVRLNLAEPFFHQPLPPETLIDWFNNKGD